MPTNSLTESLHACLVPIAFIGICLTLISCNSGTNTSNDNSSSEALSQSSTISVDEALEMIEPTDADTGATIQEDEGYKMYIDNASKLLSDTALCNSGHEPFRQFIEAFASESSFRDQRIMLYPTSYRVPVSIIDTNTFEHSAPDSEGFFSAWRVLDRDSAVFSYGWVDSELAIEYTFIRQTSGQWYLVDYFNIDSIPQ